MLIVFTMLFAYLLGAVSSAIIVCKIFRLPDPRTQGSHNPGATNVLRLGGKKLAVLTLLGDLLKGVIAVSIARILIPPEWWGWVGLCVVVGHIYPLFFQFKGGKGVATGAGVLLALSWPLGLAVIMTWIIVVLISRYSSLAAIAALVAVPVYGFWLAKFALLSLCLICVLILLRHQDNIKRLLAGTESKMGKSA
jgi:glycerol-3-phosphate acyltransferase PlsY